jgi:hypothetical protein
MRSGFNKLQDQTNLWTGPISCFSKMKIRIILKVIRVLLLFSLKNKVTFKVII